MNKYFIKILIICVIFLFSGQVNSQCNPLLAPFFDDIETHNATTTLSSSNCWNSNGTGFDWNIDGNGSTPSTGTGPSSAHSGSNYFYTEATGGSTGDITTLESPIIDLSPLINPQISFYYHMHGVAMGDLAIQVNNGTGWNTIDSISGEQQLLQTDPWIYRAISIPSYVNDTIQIRFKAFRGTSYTSDICLDDIGVSEAPSCPQPSLLSLQNLSSDSATISWVPGLNETQWNVFLVPDTGSLNNTIPTLVNHDTVSLAVNSNTSYSFYVQGICSSADTSAIAGPLSFLTPCGPFNTPQLEDFSTGFPPNQCWDEASTGDPGTGPSTFGTGSWAQDGFANQGFTGAVKIWLRSTFQSDWILSPEYDLTSSTTHQVEFDFGVFTFGTSNPGVLGSDDRVELLITSDGGLNWLPLASYSGNYITGPNGNHEIIQLGAYTGNIVRFAFWGSDGIIDDVESNDVMVDNFEVKISPSCPEPLSLQVSNLSNDSATVSWTPGGTELQWIVQWGPTGFSPISGMGDTTSTTNLTITSLASSTAYDVYVQAICTNGDSSSWAGPYTFNTPIQGPQGVTCSSGNPGFVLSDDLESQAGWTGDFTAAGLGWRMNSGITPSTGTGPSSAHSGSNYFYFECTGGGNSTGTIVSPLVDLTFGANDAELSFWVHAYGATMGTLDVGVGASPTGPFNTIFTNTGQIQSNNSDPYQNVGINLGSYIGQQVYLAFTYTKSASYTGDIAIDLVEVTSCLSCPAPSNITLNNLSADTVNISWLSNSSDSLWLVYLAPNNTPIGNITPFVANNDTIDIVVNPSTNYDVYVQSICSIGDSSILAGPLNFVTPCAPISSLPYIEEMSFWPPDCWDLTGGTRTCVHYNGSMAEASFWGWNTGNAYMTSPTFDVSSMVSPLLLFDWSHSYSSIYPNDALEVLISDDNGTNWTQVWYKSGTDLESNDGAGNTTPGSFVTSDNINLSSFGNNIMVRFNFISGYGPDCFLDNVQIIETPTNDIGTISGSVNSSAFGCELDSSVVTINLFNYGINYQVGFDVQYSVNAVPVIETILDTIHPYDSLSYNFNTLLDLTQDGTYSIDFKTNLNNDVDSTNDFFGTLNFENLIAPAGPVGINDTICLNSGDSLMLIASSPIGTVSWYDSAAAGNLLSYGDTLLTYVNSTTTFYASVSSSINDSLETSNVGGNGYQGNVFNIRNTSGNPLTITGFSQGGDVSSTNVSMEVWMYEGDYTNAINDDSSWTKIGDDIVNLVAGTASGYVGVSNAVIPPGSTYGFRVGSTSSSAVRYTNGTGTPGLTIWASNADLSISEGHGGAYPYYSQNNPRNWNGIVHYLSEGCAGVSPVIGVVEDCTNMTDPDESKIKLYPNPNNGNFIISQSGNYNNAKFEIIDVNGKILIKEYLHNAVTEVKLNNIDPGVYFINIIGESKRTTKSIIVQ